MSRGDRREPIFLDDEDRKTFVRTLAEACEKTGWQVHAWCLMGNHFHLVAETLQSNQVVRCEPGRVRAPNVSSIQWPAQVRRLLHILGRL